VAQCCHSHPWNKVEGWQVVKAYAGLCIGATNHNLFQKGTYCLGSLCHIEKAVRQQAIDHVP
jgi:L-rhamnose isomerase/sugar isomerase